MVLSASAALLSASVSVAQTSAPVTPRPEHFGVGVSAALGSEGAIGAFRASLPTSDRFRVELSAGHVHESGEKGTVADGFSFSAQLHWLWRGRSASGWSGYWLFGPQVLEASSRTPVIWPDGTRTWFVEDRLIATVQGGYGWDWLSPHGARTGVEVSGGSTYGVPVVFAHVFLVWGPARR
jgi:hypothetical protein